MIATELVLGLLAAGMAAATAVLVKWSAEARTPLRASVVVFLLLMMVAMVGGAAVYYIAPSTTSLVEGFWVAGALMSISVIVVFLGLLAEIRGREANPEDPGRRAPRSPFRAYFASVIAIVLANEFLMGWTFSAAAGVTIGAAADLGSVLTALANVVDSPWFLFTMSAEMLLTAYFFRARLPRSVLVVLSCQSVIMLLSPPALGLGAWVAISVFVGSALMIGLFVFLFEYLYRNREIPRAFSGYLARLLAVYALMMAGLFFWLVWNSALGFAASIVFEMILYFDLVLRPERFDDPNRVNWQLRPHWTFSVLFFVFVAELFMGAVLSAQIFGGDYTAVIPALPLSGNLPTVAYNAFYNGFWFFALATNSTWFLIMMGLEMGALVAFKFRETRNRETRVRLGLLMASYAAFVVFFPSDYYSIVFPNLASGAQVPVLGWSMGIGSAPLAVGVFGVVLATYAIMGAASFLFGRRAICSVFCMAPLMYQGTAIDAMKSFNRSSPTARKYLSSRFSGLYSATTAVVMVSLVLASMASYLDQAGIWNLAILGEDPTVFLFALYFSVLWYVLFVTIPYTGSYNCVTMGWCYTGTITQAVSRVGFFRLKVYDREVCRRCTTLDCAKSCPVGLVDMPGHFRTKGEFRSSKCCGVGDCVEACPYGNMYFHDARHWFRERLGLPAPTRRGTPLPMVRSGFSATAVTSTGRGTPSSLAARPPAPSVE